MRGAMLRSKPNRELAEPDFDWLAGMLSRVVGPLVPRRRSLRRGDPRVPGLPIAAAVLQRGV